MTTKFDSGVRCEMADEEKQELAEAPVTKPRYHQITEQMVDGFDFEQVIRDALSADCASYRDIFWKAAEIAEAASNENAATVYSALSALCGFHFRPNDVNDPYGPMTQMDGMRSAIPEDFRANAGVVAKMAESANDPALKARLCDVAWLLNRRRVDLGLAAISAYVQTVGEVDAGVRKFRFDSAGSPFSPPSRDLLKRALSLASMRSVGLGKKEEADVRGLVNDLFTKALSGTDPRDVQRIAKLTLQHSVVAPLDVARRTEAWVLEHARGDGHQRLDLLRLCASAYHDGGSMPDHYRCRIEAVETQFRMAQAEEKRSAMVAANLLADAISDLHGIPDVKERRRELRHYLVDVQVNISDELGSFSHEIDLKEIVADREASLDGLSLRDMLFAFAAMARSPNPDDLRSQAIKSIEDHPLSAIFSSSFHDRDGKVSFRSPGADLMSAPSDEALKPSIAQSERIRREIFAASEIHTARRIINENHFVSDDTFIAILKYSGFVPDNLVRTYSRGFRRFMQGDAVSGVYILTPLLEASIRHILKGRGHDVSTFDNATKTQQDLTISAMFDQMRGELVEVFGAAIVTDIENVFLSQPGPTVRHQIAHGLMGDGHPYGPDAAYACWLIFRLCIIPLFPHREEFDEQLWL